MHAYRTLAAKSGCADTHKAPARVKQSSARAATIDGGISLQATEGSALSSAALCESPCYIAQMSCSARGIIRWWC